MATFHGYDCMMLPPANAKAPITEGASASSAPVPATEPRVAAPLTLSIVVPCHNEEKVLPETARRLCATLGTLVTKGLIVTPRIIFIEDGSIVDTSLTIENLAAEEPRIHGLKLSRNFGQPNAILAGLLTAQGDILISIDADLQDDVNAVEEMVRAHSAGAEVVYGVRSDRSTDGFLKRTTAEAYYRLLKAMGVQLVFNHADFRLLSRRVVEHLRGCNESNLLLRGLIPQLGFRSAQVLYDRRLRLAGETKYPLRRMVGLGIDGITSFSAVPLRLIAATGAILFVLSSMVALWVIAIRVFTDRAVPGWASITLPIYALGGVQLLSLGVVGEYVAKIYLEVKRRPRYIIERTTRDRTVDQARNNS